MDLHVHASNSTRVQGGGECPVCLNSVSGASPISKGNAKPKPGDISVCVYCGAILEFDDTLNLQAISEESFQTLPSVTRDALNRISEQIKQIAKRRNELSRLGVKGAMIIDLDT